MFGTAGTQFEVRRSCSYWPPPNFLDTEESTAILVAEARTLEWLKSKRVRDAGTRMTAGKASARPAAAS